MRVSISGAMLVLASAAAGAFGATWINGASSPAPPGAASGSASIAAAGAAMAPPAPAQAATVRIFTAGMRAPKLFAVFTPPPRIRLLWPESPFGADAVMGSGAADDGLDSAYVTGGAVNLRDEPSTEAGVLRVIPWGKRLMALGESSGDWRRVLDVESGAEGWMFGRYLADEMPKVRKTRRRKARTAKIDKPLAIIPPPTDRVWDALAAEGRVICPCR